MGNLGEKKALLAVVGVTVLLTAGALYLTYSSYEKAEQGKQKIQGVRNDIVKALAKKRMIPALEREVIILRENVEEYVKILPEDKQINNFVNRINEFQTDAGIELTGLDAPARRSAKKKGKSATAFERFVYKLKVSGTFRDLVRFINKFENYERFVAVEDFSFKPDKRTPADEDMRLTGGITIETYAYHAGAAASDRVKIAKIDDKREALRDQIMAQRNEIEILRHHLDPVVVDGRRDPFKDPRRPKVAENEEGEGNGAERFAKQKRFVAWAVGELKQINDMIVAEENEPLIIRQMEIKKQIDERVGNLSAQLSNARNDRLVTAGPLQRELEREVLDPLARIIKDRRIAVKTGLSVQDLEMILTKMQHYFKKGELGQVVSQFDLVAKQLGTTDTGDPDTKALVVKIYGLKNKAMVISEFSKRPIAISGIISVKGSPVAIINGRVFEKGEMLDEDVKIHDIRSEEVEFVFRDVRIIRRWE